MMNLPFCWEIDNSLFVYGREQTIALLVLPHANYLFPFVSYHRFNCKAIIAKTAQKGAQLYCKIYCDEH